MSDIPSSTTRSATPPSPHTVNQLLVPSERFLVIRFMQKQDFKNKVKEIHGLFDKKDLIRIDFIICAIHSMKYLFPLGICIDSLMKLVSEHFKDIDKLESLVYRMCKQDILLEYSSQMYNVTPFGMCYLLGVC
jgi:hypothetical protein